MLRVYLYAAIICCTGILQSIAGSAQAKSLVVQRIDYQAAQKALAAKQYQRFGKLSSALTSYPLYPYLKYADLSARLHLADDAEVIDFLRQHADLPQAQSLRMRWLKQLAYRKRWQTLLDHYVPEVDVITQCYQLQARINTARDSSLLDDIRAVWLVGHSQPDACDKPFEFLQASGFMHDKLIWERLALAMREGKTGLANYLSRKLSNDYKKWALLWAMIYKRPALYTQNPSYEDNELAREILSHAITRLARQDIKQAIKHWDNMRAHYRFSIEQLATVQYAIGTYAARRNHESAIYLLDQIPNDHIDEALFNWRIKTALQALDWAALKRWTAQPFPQEKNTLRREYWYARALQKHGETQMAQQIFTRLAQEADYYGFLSADQIEADYVIYDKSLSIPREEIDRVANIPAMQRSYELYQINPHSYRSRLEWVHALNGMNMADIEIAAFLAFKQQRYHLAILSFGKARSYDALTQRFPLPFSDLLDKYAKKRQLDLSLLYGLIRAESGFRESVKSPAGALGLMQVMPKTGHMIAKKIGLPLRTHRLQQANFNIPIGTAYLKDMLQRFDENIMFSVAAYNAGPHRVEKWLPKKKCMAADIWVEEIPFNETRKYVKRVLYFSTIYDWRRSVKGPLIKQRMNKTAGNLPLAGSKHCAPRNMAYQ